MVYTLYNITYYTMLCCTTLHCTTLHYIHIVLHYTVRQIEGEAVLFNECVMRSCHSNRQIISNFYFTPFLTLFYPLFHFFSLFFIPILFLFNPSITFFSLIFRVIYTRFYSLSIIGHRAHLENEC